MVNNVNDILNLFHDTQLNEIQFSKIIFYSHFLSILMIIRNIQ